MKISLVVPVFNEEATIPIFYKTVREFEELKPYEVEIVFINDGSKDATESIINKIAHLIRSLFRFRLREISVKNLLFSRVSTMQPGMRSFLWMSIYRIR